MGALFTGESFKCIPGKTRVQFLRTVLLGGGIWSVELVRPNLAVSACVLTATTKKGRQL